MGSPREVRCQNHPWRAVHLSTVWLSTPSLPQPRQHGRWRHWRRELRQRFDAEVAPADPQQVIERTRYFVELANAETLRMLGDFDEASGLMERYV